MSKSFEDQINERLRDYTHTPEASAKSRILDQVNSQHDPIPAAYHYLGGVLLLLALSMVGYQKMTASEQELDFATAPQGYQQSVHVQKPQNFQIAIEELDEKLTAGYSPNETSGVAGTLGIIPETSPPSSAERSPNHFSVMEPIMPLLDELGSPPSKFRLSGLIFKEKEEVIVPGPKRWFNTYFTVGSFFLYNRLQPNLDDDVFVDHYDAPFGISAKRIGFSADLGLESNWGGPVKARVGLIANNYSQQFSFSMRNTIPDTVILSNDSEFLEPQFNTELININRRVTTLGVRFMTTWNFPTRFNAIYAAAEYHWLLGRGVRLSYQDETYELSQPQQFMLEIGLSKLLYEGSNGYFSVNPGFRYSLQKMDGDEPIQVKPFSLGVSLTYSLK